MIDWAFCFGSSVGTLDAPRVAVRLLDMMPGDIEDRVETVGRTRLAPRAVLARREAIADVYEMRMAWLVDR